MPDGTQRAGGTPAPTRLDEIYQAGLAAPSWTDQAWTPKRQRSPCHTDGLYMEEAGKVVVWVLTRGLQRLGHDPEPCGFHLASRTFDDDCEGADDEVMVWAPLSQSLLAELRAA